VPDGNSSDNDVDAMSVVIDREKYTALMPLIRTTPGYVGEKVQPNKYTLKCSFSSGFACCISKNDKNTNLSVHFENEGADTAAHLAILNAIS
jgi:hypothetical protein